MGDCSWAFQACQRIFHRCTILLLFALIMLSGCCQLRLPAIDPSGNRIFLPATTELLTPGTTTGTVLGLNPLRRQADASAGGIYQPAPFQNQPAPTPQYPVQPAFQNPPDPPPCNQPVASRHEKKHLIPKTTGPKTAGQNGQILMTPSRIVAPVGSEVVVLAGICGGDGYLVKNQPLEWMLSNNSVGEIIEVGGTTQHRAFNSLVPPTSKKIDGQYAKGRTGLKKLILSRGTPTPVDDIELQEGQTYISVASASPGTTYVTGLAPKAEGWDRRRASTRIHWVDAQWSIPAPTQATAGTVYPLTTIVSRASDTGGVEDWTVRYSIVGGAPAEFAPTGSQSVEARTDRDGRATVQLRQVAGQFEPGTTQIRVDIVRPPIFGEPELVVESGITSVTWSAPALTIRAIGPRSTAIDLPFNYRVEVSNPGDQIARDVVVRTRNLDDGIEFISSNPKPTEYGRQYEWRIGDIAPRSAPRVIVIQLKSKKRGNVGVCFEVASETDRLRTEACAETEITAPCISTNIEGPSTAQVGEQITFNLNVQNQCDEALEDLQLTVRHDPGLLRPGKSNPSTFRLDRLQFGETQSLPLTFDVQSVGTQCFEVEITAKGGQPAYRQQRCIDVGPIVGGGTSPQIGLQILGGQPMEVGGDSIVEVQILNRGSAVIRDAVLTNRFSTSLEPISVSPEFVDVTRMISNEELAIALGDLNPGQSKIVQLQYLGKIIDGSAISEFAVTSPSGASATSQANLRVEAAGTLPNQPRQPVRPDFGGQNGDIGIPSDPAPGQGDLSVSVKTLDPNIQVSNMPQPNPNLAQESRVEFVIRNTRTSPIRDVDITLLVPPGTQLKAFDYGTTNLKLVNRNNDFTKFFIQRCNELRPNEELRFMATVIGLQPGIATIEVTAESLDTAGSRSGRDTLVISQ